MRIIVLLILLCGCATQRTEIKVTLVGDHQWKVEDRNDKFLYEMMIKIDGDTLRAQRIGFELK